MTPNNHQDIFSCNLVESSKLHRCFLRNLHKYGITLTRPSYESFRRYSQLWLPFLARQYQQQQQELQRKEKDKNAESPSNSSLLLLDVIPPADIAWIWHCHRLAPYRYAKYIEKTFFTSSNDENQHPHDDGIMVLESRYPFVFQMEDNLDNETLYSYDTTSNHDSNSLVVDMNCKRTREAFAEMYPNESFFLSTACSDLTTTSTTATEGPITNYGRETLLDGFDVISSCERQASFLWQVSGPNFDQDSFLYDGVENYLKFVRLMGQEDSATTTTTTTSSKPKFLVPTYQIDLMWHTHILNSIAKYHQDNIRLNACILEHDDSLNDRSEGGTLDVNFKATRKLWHQVYKEEYRVHGGMYRGEPPMAFFDASWATHHVSFDHHHHDHHHHDDGLVMQGMNLSHLIGKVGASSVGKNVADVWMSIDAPDAFLPANPKSTTRTNANPIKDGYIFGKGDQGWGYYNLNTREAYKVALVRIQNRIKSTKAAKITCMALGLLVIFLPCVLMSMKGYKQRISELEDLILVVTKRLDSYGPSADIDLPDDVLGRLQSSSLYKTRYNDTKRFYDDPEFYTVAAACGGGGFAGDGGGDGAGCGGGGCGGGGCGGGGGGCGGGGCGGGGCGGGGCGG